MPALQAGSANFSSRAARTLGCTNFVTSPCSEAIYAGEDIYEIDPARCTECVGHFDEPQCRKVCPVDCIPLDPANVESREELLLKFERLRGPH